MSNASCSQSVDFGRLNLGRAPDPVIEHAFDEAINKMNIATEMTLDPAGRLVLTLPDTETGLDVVKTIDSPGENLALYIEMMTDGDWYTEDVTPTSQGGRPQDNWPLGGGPSKDQRPVLDESAQELLEALGYGDLGIQGSHKWEDSDGKVIWQVELDDNELLLAASLLAAAADKTGSITLDKVVYINSIFGINQLGTLGGEIEGKSYFDFSGFGYNRGLYTGRSSGACNPGWVEVLQPELDESNEEVPDHFVTTCMPLLGWLSDPSVNSVHFVNMVEAYTTVFVKDESGTDIPLEYNFEGNVRGFTQAADDALQVIEYIHNYKVPEVLYE
jgi:hypothetical protein